MEWSFSLPLVLLAVFRNIGIQIIRSGLRLSASDEWPLHLATASKIAFDNIAVACKGNVVCGAAAHVFALVFLSQ